MRIVYITAGAGDMYCGSCLRDGALAAALKALGHDVLFVPTYTPLRIEADDISVHRLFYGGINVYLQQKIPIFRHTPRFLDQLFDSNGLLRLAARFGHLTTAHDLAKLTISVLKGERGAQRKELVRLVAWLEGESRPDAVILPNSLLAGLAAPLRRSLGAPVFCLVSGEDMFVHEFPEPYRRQALDLLRARAADCDGFIAPNRYYAGFMTDYLDRPPGKMNVVPLGIDCRGFAEKERWPAAFTIGYLARICPQKGLHRLVETFKILKGNPETSSCRLHVAGYLAGEHRRYFERIRAEIAEAGLSDSFTYAGEVSRKEKMGFLAGLSALSVPTVYPEPKGQFVAEALAAGTPVVLPSGGCLTEWVEDTGGGLLCQPDSPEDLADALARLMADPDLARRLGRAGRDAVFANHTAERMAGRVVETLAGAAC